MIRQIAMSSDAGTALTPFGAVSACQFQAHRSLGYRDLLTAAPSSNRREASLFNSAGV